MRKSKNKYVVYYITSEGYESYVIRENGRFMHNATLFNATIFSKEDALKCKKLLNEKRTGQTIKWRIKQVRS